MDATANSGETIEDVLSAAELEELRRSYDAERHDTLPWKVAVSAAAAIERAEKSATAT